MTILNTVTSTCYTYWDETCIIVGFINADTNPSVFDSVREKNPKYSLNKGDSFGDTALATAASFGNIPLIEHIVNIGGRSLLTLANSEGYTPLHRTSDCENPENAYLATKKLIQLGTPVNSVIRESKLWGQTPLEYALIKGQTKIAALLLMLGGEAKIYPGYKGVMQGTLEEAVKQVDADNEKLFLLKTGSKDHFPEDIVNLLSKTFVESV